VDEDFRPIHDWDWGIAGGLAGVSVETAGIHEEIDASGLEPYAHKGIHLD
jgi:hypothetical protein